MFNIINNLMQCAVMHFNCILCDGKGAKMSMLDCWTQLSSCLTRTLHMGKLRINPSHVTMCSVTCEIYSVAIVIVTQDERRDHQRPHYIVKSVNQLENQSEV